ncbi:ThuA domain-containing protein [Rhodobacterales bacterium HKCCE2091]|nr:ThuA domain-containing protein [Rhodobacterales bacterium HKCCE2091]
MTRNLVLSGGIFHPFAETSAMLAAILAEHGIESEVVAVKDGLARLAGGEMPDMLTFNCLAWGMYQNAKYEPYRAEFAHETSEAERAALREHVATGKPLLAMHAAPICFDDWPDWGDLIGARWIWGQSGHPAPGPVSVDGPEGRFDIVDELYCGLDIAADAEVLATARAEVVAEPQPILLRRSTGGARVIFDALGHDERSFATAGHRAILAASARWLTGQDARVTA